MTDPCEWKFWIDRGGTFTDVVARRPDGCLQSMKLLSENPDQYPDAATEAVRRFLQVDRNSPIPVENIHSVRMGSTVATNALLERKGEPTLLAITAGFKDALAIGYQNRPDLFALEIQRAAPLYSKVIEIEERLSAQGDVVIALNESDARSKLQSVFDDGITSIAIALMHGYRYSDHERRLIDIARGIGFQQISASHSVSPLVKLVARAETTVVDAYLTPVLRRYVDSVESSLGATRLLFMQSHGGLTEAHQFQGKDAILSGPAGGIVGAVEVAKCAGIDKIITFDMGGTSTDVAHYAGEYERCLDTEVAGVRMRVPMLQIHTVAAGGGSVLTIENGRFQVGPDSAGANPGPRCYRRNGPLAVTDANLVLGRIQAEFFPAIFGDQANLPLDLTASRAAFERLLDRHSGQLSERPSIEGAALGFRRIAIENMANAIKKISTERGYDVQDYMLVCFGGAGGQHVCDLADALGMRKVLLHPLNGVLSAFGMGLAHIRNLEERTVNQPFERLDSLREVRQGLIKQTKTRLLQQGIPPADIEFVHRLHLRYAGSDTSLAVVCLESETTDAILARFEESHRQEFGFLQTGSELIIDMLSCEAIGREADARNLSARPNPELASNDGAGSWPQQRSLYVSETAGWQQVPVYQRDLLNARDSISGPAIILEGTGTVIVEPDWVARIDNQRNLLLSREKELIRPLATGTEVDPIALEIFNNRFMSIAEQMGVRLARTSHSVNIKERLDFSCALFDRDGNLVANAPHVPVHLGSMSETIRYMVSRHAPDSAQPWRNGDSWVINDPYNGGTHFPDVTVVTPVLDAITNELQFVVASRGHHADIGGISPGSMPPHSSHIEEEGVLIGDFLLLRNGDFREAEIRELLASGPHPARSIDLNIADLKAQIAANNRGIEELQTLTAQNGVEVVNAYMSHVQNNAEAQVRQAITQLSDGNFTCTTDFGAQISVAVQTDRENRRAVIDFRGTSPQSGTNFNAPKSITRAAVLYVFRCLVEAPIPLNEGCLRPVDIRIPDGSMLNPEYPAAVVAGNVETSQLIVDALFAALGVMANSQGTMNNFTFGNDSYQYYETICGGQGGGPDYSGASAVQTHMTNSRLTDPEILELRFPVRLLSFSIRHGSGGSGLNPGGDGVIRHLQFLQPMQVSMLAGRRCHNPAGLQGGAAGHSGSERLIRSENGDCVMLQGVWSREVEPGDEVEILTPGGGGFGNVS